MSFFRFLCRFGLAGLAFLCGCAEPQPAPQPPDPAQPLHALSTEQLRVWLRGADVDWRPTSGRALGLPEPAAHNPVPPDARVIDLAEPDLAQFGQQPLARALVERRSRRSYTQEPLALTQLGFLLWSAQGTSAMTLDEAGRIERLYRTTPSGGGAYPLETYVFVQRVEGLEPGLYRYRPREHQLVEVGIMDTADDLGALCYGTPAAAGAAALVAWTAVPARTEWRYGIIAHRMIAMEAGHACQNLYLAAESLGLGTCALLAYDQKLLDARLGVNGQDEFAIYLASIGKVE